MHAAVSRGVLNKSPAILRHSQCYTTVFIRRYRCPSSAQQFTRSFAVLSAVPATANLMAQQAIDLTATDSDEESPTAAAAREAAQRQSIMEFARAKRARTGPAPSDVQAASAAAAAGSSGPSRQDSKHDKDKDKDDIQQPAEGQAAAATGNSSAFGNDDLKALHEARMQRLRAQQAAAGTSSSPDKSRSTSSERQGAASGGAAAAAAAGAGTSRSAAPDWFTGQLGGSGSSSQQVSLLTYNVWFREDVAVRQRMQGIADIITASGYPTFICFQEVTPLIMQLFSGMPWWQRYVCSSAPNDAPYFTLLLVNKAAAPSVSSSSFEEVHFDNSQMGRSLRVATVTLGGRKLLVATSHLESPIPPQQWFSRERQQQMGFSLAQLQKAPYGNILFAGDMNWTDSRDGAPPLPPGWCDAWQQLHPADPGYTYDARSNPMLPYKSTPPLRLDRVFARLADFKLGSVSTVGKQQLGEATYRHSFKSGGSKELPVLPSDHFGLLLKLELL